MHPTLSGRELFRSDGTVAGTQLLANIEAGLGASDPREFVRVGDFAYFVADTSLHGAEPWRTDGSAAGTTRITISSATRSLVQPT